MVIVFTSSMRSHRLTPLGNRNLGKELTNEQYKEALRQRNVFRDWVLGDFLPRPSGSDSLNKILVMPNGFMHPVYRHEYDGWVYGQLGIFRYTETNDLPGKL